MLYSFLDVVLGILFKIFCALKYTVRKTFQKQARLLLQATI